MRVLIVGASGGVNLASIQIAKFTGAQVIVVGSDRGKLVLAESESEMTWPALRTLSRHTPTGFRTGLLI